MSHSKVHIFLAFFHFEGQPFPKMSTDINLTIDKFHSDLTIDAYL
jgi:hypothetical protein